MDVLLHVYTLSGPLSAEEISLRSIGSLRQTILTNLKFDFRVFIYMFVETVSAPVAVRWTENEGPLRWLTQSDIFEIHTK